MNPRPPLLHAIMPPFDRFNAPRLSYPELQQTVDRYCSDEYKAVDGGFVRFHSDDEVAADTLPQKYLPVLALKIQQAETDEERTMWSQRFTDLSVRLFGQPNLNEAIAIANYDLKALKTIWQKHDISASVVEPMFKMYQRFIKQMPTKEPIAPRPQYTALLTALRAHLVERLAPVYAVMAEYEEGDVMDAETIRWHYAQMLSQLAVFAPVWKKWRVVASESAQMAVSPRYKEIQVGAYLPSLTVRRVKSLFTHEVLVHAQRSVRGAIYDHQLAYGLPGYVTAEEGLGMLMEAAVEGKMPYRAGDRYVDIAMALGLSDQPPVNRHQLFPVVYARTLLRRLDEGAPIDHDLINRASWQHINRIYRGTLGNEFVGVFTKDVIYYRGYRKMADYLSRYQGPDLRQAIDFVLSGKINPADPVHRLYMHERKFNIIRKEEPNV
ncbi:MAG TPA: tyrosine/phenylalanine carboxypeptidase domain-containing protein [Candidatus Saccharimonadales bacterium]|nr:tyrosine/phenylalanine carboxypeptidase domain-containing protein [Candidatus Saccharimonadales bacterium]